MIETVIVPAAVLFFLMTWMTAEEATFRRTMQRIAARPVPAPQPVPVERKKSWLF